MREHRVRMQKRSIKNDRGIVWRKSENGERTHVFRTTKRIGDTHLLVEPRLPRMGEPLTERHMAVLK